MISDPALKLRRPILFSGHMIDRPGRIPPRFPPAMEMSATIAMRSSLELIKGGSDRDVFGIAGAACGGDIIFHESCIKAKIPSVIFLALPPSEFISGSVAFAGQNWVDRFYMLCDELPTFIYDPSNDPPESFSNEIRLERTNLWMMNEALQTATDCMLLAFWNRQESDGNGGTKHMVEAMRSLGKQVVIIDPAEL